ncbi:hypothetical protein [Embleya sp. NBC_00896]|uniref:hypothetical protein n=1 Tax=Embleya sp. NBC_00896 TaxID=2975961 RepID=UPI00386A7DCB|nr:hypothetical protein OG928_30820 [Embleya sp. NBC_00896]
MDATDRHDRPREAVASLRAHWAWYLDGGVPACSAGPERRGHFERLLRPTLDEHAPPGWVGVTTTGREDPFVAMTLRDPDGVRYFTAPYAEIADSGVSYTTLWLAFRGIDLPTDRERPLRVRLPGTAAGGGTRADDFDWFAGVAAAVLAGPVVITGADRLDTRARLELLDRVAGLLPYGCRAGLRFATSLGPTGRLRPRLAFGRVVAPGTVGVGLDGVPAVPEAPAARAYLGELTTLRRRVGLNALVAALATLREPGAPAAGEHLLGLLAEAGARAAGGGVGHAGPLSPDPPSPTPPNCLPSRVRQRTGHVPRRCSTGSWPATPRSRHRSPSAGARRTATRSPGTWPPRSLGPGPAGSWSAGTRPWRPAAATASSTCCWARSRRSCPAPRRTRPPNSARRAPPSRPSTARPGANRSRPRPRRWSPTCVASSVRSRPPTCPPSTTRCGTTRSCCAASSTPRAATCGPGST